MSPEQDHNAGLYLGQMQSASCSRVCDACSPLIGGLNGSLGSRAHSGLAPGEPGTPRASRSSLNPGTQGSPGQGAAPRAHLATDMQVCCDRHLQAVNARRTKVAIV